MLSFSAPIPTAIPLIGDVFASAFLSSSEHSRCMVQFDYIFLASWFRMGIWTMSYLWTEFALTKLLTFPFCGWSFERLRQLFKGVGRGNGYTHYLFLQRSNPVCVTLTDFQELRVMPINTKGYLQVLLQMLALFLPVNVQFTSVTQSCLTLCNPMDCSKSGFPVYHQLLELAPTHVHWILSISKFAWWIWKSISTCSCIWGLVERNLV